MHISPDRPAQVSSAMWRIYNGWSDMRVFIMVVLELGGISIISSQRLKDYN